MKGQANLIFSVSAAIVFVIIVLLLAVTGETKNTDIIIEEEIVDPSLSEIKTNAFLELTSKSGMKMYQLISIWIYESSNTEGFNSTETEIQESFDKFFEDEKNRIILTWEDKIIENDKQKTNNLELVNRKIALPDGNGEIIRMVDYL